MLSPNIRRVLESLDAFKEGDIYAEDGEPFISINKLTGKAGVFYEKLRYLVDYKEEHTIRRSAIERILKRKLLIKINEGIGLSLLQELVGSGYLPNKKVSEGIAGNIQMVINKYLLLGALAKIENSRIISLMASEIEIFLFPQRINNLIVDCFYQTVSGNIKYGGAASQDDLQIQIYIGCRRSLLEDDRETLLYAVLAKHIPELPMASTEEEIRGVASIFAQSMSATNKEIRDPLGWTMTSKLRNHSVYFSAIKEIIKKYGTASEEIFANQSRLEEEARNILSEKYRQQYNIVSKSGTRAIIYVFLTKIVLAFMLELPYEKFILSSVDYFALGINIIFHPVLLFAIVKTILPPSPNNTMSIISGIRAITHNENIKLVHIKPPISNVFHKTIFGILYLMLFAVSFGLILWTLKLLNFNIISMALFLFFLTIVSYFGFRIRYNAKKWMVSTEDEGAIILLWSFFTIPIIRTGRWLSSRFSSVNIFVFIMDFILETPFKFVLETFDSFISFLKEKKEDSY